MAAACRHFAERGYDRTAVRSIATEAGVDPALIRYFFGSKAELFAQVTEPPFDLDELVAIVFAGERDGMGERLARFVVSRLEEPETRARILGLIRATTSEPEAARMVRETLSRKALEKLAPPIDRDDAQLRVELVASQVFGLVVMRYVIEIEPLASAAPEAVVEAIAPTLQRYLGGPL